MQLPNLWLWDMIDEYLYQFQSFCQYRGKVSVKTKQELELLKQCDNVWNAVGVLNYLQALVDKSGIVQTLANERESRGPDASFSEREGYDHKASNVLTALGYFALIGSCRVRCLLGEYEPALLALDPIDLDKPGLFTKVAGARVSVAYHVGFAYFMLGRYTDAARHFNGALLFVNRRKVSATKLVRSISHWFPYDRVGVVNADP
jgi:translation initiation factor 3 subunit L